MSFRSVEMQIAIPRTSEIGSVQNHLMQKPAYDQALLAAKASQEKERHLRQSVKIDEPSASLIRQRQRGNDGKDREQKKNHNDRSQADTGGEQTLHPYKGRHIDFSL